MSKFYIILFFLLLGAVDNLSAKEKNINTLPTQKEVKEFAIRIADCLKTENKECLSKYVRENMNFLEYKEFGCKSQKGELFTSEEFSECVYSSPVTYAEKTLKNALEDCFTNPKSNIMEKGRQVTSPAGFICSYDWFEGILKIESIMLGC